MRQLRIPREAGKSASRRRCSRLPQSRSIVTDHLLRRARGGAATSRLRESSRGDYCFERRGLAVQPGCRADARGRLEKPATSRVPLGPMAAMQVRRPRCAGRSGAVGARPTDNYRVCGCESAPDCFGPGVGGREDGYRRGDRDGASGCAVNGASGHHVPAAGGRGAEASGSSAHGQGGWPEGHISGSYVFRPLPRSGGLLRRPRSGSGARAPHALVLAERNPGLSPFSATGALPAIAPEPCRACGQRGSRVCCDQSGAVEFAWLLLSASGHARRRRRRQCRGRFARRAVTCSTASGRSRSSRSARLANQHAVNKSEPPVNPVYFCISRLRKSKP